MAKVGNRRGLADLTGAEPVQEQQKQEPKSVEETEEERDERKKREAKAARDWTTVHVVLDKQQLKRLKALKNVLENKALDTGDNVPNRSLLIRGAVEALLQSGADLSGVTEPDEIAKRLLGS